MKRQDCLVWMFLVLGIIFSFKEAWSQGKIVGHVKDKHSGEPLIGANVMILKTNLGAATDLEGDYTIINVPVGRYSIQTSYMGYSKLNKVDVFVSQGQTTKLDFDLEEEAVEGDVVTVVAERNVLHKEVSGSQTIMLPDQITEAAGVNNLHEYLATQAGITDPDFLKIRGGNPQETGTIINGFTFVNTRIGKSEVFIPTSSIEQVSMQSGGMTAEYGEFRSGVIDVTTKTGLLDRYHGTFSFKRNQAQLKRFGRSIFDPMHNNLRPHLDPDIAFIGVNEAVDQGILSDYEVQQFVYYPTFRGFANMVGRRLPATWQLSMKDKGYSTDVLTPVDLYLFDAWMHMVNPDFDKLNSVIDSLNAQGLDVGEKITDQKLIDLFKDHAAKEGREFDYVFDGGFGGPVPFIGKKLGDMTFYLSNISARTAYIQPKQLDSDFNSTTMLTLKTTLNKRMNLKLTGAYNYHKGLAPNHGGDSEVPNLGQTLDIVGAPAGLDRGRFMPEDNITLFSGTGWGGAYGPPMWWYHTDVPVWKQTTSMIGAEFTHTLNAKSFYEVNVSYQRTRDNIDPKEDRDPEVLYHLNGGLPLNEMPYGWHLLPVLQRVDTVDGWVFDEFYSIPGLEDRFGGKAGVVVDHSLTEQVRAKVNYGNQINKVHYIKAGTELLYMNLDNNRFGYWCDPGSAYDYNFKVKPITLGAYLQDEITYEEMVLNIGARVDYFGEVSGLKWPTGRRFDDKAFGTPSEDPPNWLERLYAGGSPVWDMWRALDEEYRAAGEAPLLQPVESHMVFSPRLGIAFPLTDRIKFYFNYGHFHMLPPYSEMYMYNYRYGTAKGGLYNLGNPNLEPSRTIQYELGLDYHLLDSYLIHIAGYYKDVTGEVRTIRYDPELGATFNFRTNDSYRDIQGVELQITKHIGTVFTGWAKLQYVYVSSGFSGRAMVYEDPDFNNNPDRVNYYQDPTRPDPVPQATANLTFKSPAQWGYFLGDWRLSLLPDWRQGEIFRYNPRGLDVNNEFRWPGIFLVNIAVSKTFDLKYIDATFSIDVRNLFNTKIFTYQYAFAQGLGSSTSPSSDLKNYMQSLHLEEYKDSYYDELRTEAGVDGKPEDAYLYPGYVRQDGSVVGEDHVGDLRSDDKPHINDPNIDIFTHGNFRRSIWASVKFHF